MDLITTSLISAFLLGLFSTAHCIAMCGSVIGALTLSLPAEIRQSPKAMFPYVLNYNLGRVISYALAGALVAALASPLNDIGGLQWLRYISVVFMVAMGLYLAGWMPRFAQIEKIGTPIWRFLQPLSQKLLPVKSRKQAFAFGAVWGWLPCGLVYAALVMAATTGDVVTGGMTMLAFGLGTMPAVLGAGLFVGFLSSLARNIWFRRGAGLLIIVMAIAMFMGPQFLPHEHNHDDHVAHEHHPAMHSMHDKRGES
ncbi:sulfite exporter TauE/SafE family protein [Methylophaga sp. OBS3]|uniref:sulfite exporter TauE/SafE family protein n=1 Tax=Methylophaga sp. OBS3 TaxID=2991934 RepID=UPI002253ED67|nr:sulfite exporter TauE/SafE family protein [Methylophaga sp. OBS3]MCX4189896.1 sulfite exporter TauE/SafE family protein [Methylophaga sp. OBS3]